MSRNPIRYLQKKDGAEDVDYYNRYFVRFEQPLFQPNRLKNDIERAELDLEDDELEYIDDLVDLIDDIGDDYYELFELSYRNIIHAHHVVNLEKVSYLDSLYEQWPQKVGVYRYPKRDSLYKEYYRKMKLRLATGNRRGR